MVSIDRESRKPKGGVTIPTKFFVPLALLAAWMAVMQAQSLMRKYYESNGGVVQAYQETKPIFRNPDQLRDQCKVYMAESSVAKGAGLGIFTGVGVLKDEMVGFPDLCIFIGDAPSERTHIRSHTFGWASFFGQYEGGNSRAACEGMATIYNTNGLTHINTKLVSPIQATTAGVRREDSPGAGSITHHFGMQGQALDVIPAGQELTIWYGDWDDFFEGKKLGPRPGRQVDWLKQNGWCIDHVEIRDSTIPGAGRGAFMKRGLGDGEVVMPAPLQVFRDRALFQNTEPEQLYVNYCLSPANSKMLFFPYGPTVGAINHSKNLANVKYQWSSHPMHRADLLEMSYRQFWEDVHPGALLLEVVALRDLHPGEELFMNYGDAWEDAWKSHVANWNPPQGANLYVYPEEMDETEALRTVKEQEAEPYPKNLITMCSTPDFERKDSMAIDWYSPEWEWAEAMAYCHILERNRAEDGDYEYTVSITFFKDNNEPFTAEEFEFDQTVPLGELFIDRKVPRHAIRWAEIPYLDDEHLPNVFRHPIEFPAELVANAWETKP